MTDTDAATTSKHEILKKKEAIPRPYVVEIGDRGPAQITVSGLRSGGAHSFNRLTDDEADRRAILRLTTSERASLAESGFLITEASPSDIRAEDVFAKAEAAEGAEEGEEAEEAEGAETTKGGTSGERLTAADWPLKTTPDDYLANNPDGPKADLARRMIDAGLSHVSAS